MAENITPTRVSLPGRPNCADYGVTFVVGGATLTRVPFRPATGQYTFDEDTGVYGFAHVDRSKSVTCTTKVWDGQVYVDATNVRVIP